MLMLIGPWPTALGSNCTLYPEPALPWVTRPPKDCQHQVFRLRKARQNAAGGLSRVEQVIRRDAGVSIVIVEVIINRRVEYAGSCAGWYSGWAASVIRTADTTGIRIASSSTMIPITVSISTRVKAWTSVPER